MKIQTGRLSWVLLLIGAGIFTGACKARTVGPDNPPIQFTAQALFAEYRDEDAADKKYVGKTLEVSGAVDRTGVDSANHPFVAFKGDEAGDVQCFLNDRDRDEVAKLKKGEAVTLRGTCLTRVIHVTLDNCVFVKK